MRGTRFAAVALVSSGLGLIAGGCGEAPASGKVPVKIRLGTLHHAELLGRGGVTVRLRARRGGRFPVRALIDTRGGRRRLGSARRVGIPSRRWRQVDVPLGRGGRTALAGCPTGRVVVAVGKGKRARSASAPLVLDPPDCARFFGDHAFWNEPLPRDAPLDPASNEISTALQRRVAAAFDSKLPPTINTDQYSPPVYRVGADQPTVPVHLDKPPGAAPALEKAFAAVPLPQGATASAGVDSEAVVWQPATDTLWEFWQLHLTPDGWHASWGGRLDDVSTGPGVYTGARESWGATATSLPLVGGLITPQELSRGEIDHALAMAVPDPRAGVFSRPARRTDGTSPCSNAVPEGARFRLDPSLDVEGLGLPAPVEVLARAAQRYGIFVRDRSSTVVFYAQNPLSLGSNPYPALFGGKAPWDLLKEFPWSHLQLVRMDLVKGRNDTPLKLPDGLGGCG